jgi:hypothetical protein
MPSTAALGQSRAMKPIPAGNSNSALHNGKRLALIIGNSAYTIKPLPNARNDAQDMATTLRSLGFEVILLENLTKEAMETAISDFTLRLKDCAVGLFYFAGHGFMSTQKDNYLMSVEVRENLTEAFAKDKSIALESIMSSMDESPTPAKLLIIDACRNNPFRSWGRSDQKGLGGVTPPEGMVVFFAASPSEEASENPGARNGLFTQELLKQLRIPNLELTELLRNTGNQVKKLANAQQRPYRVGDLSDVFYLNIPNTSNSTAPAQKQTAAELARQGQELYDQKRYDEALPLLKAAAEQGDVKGQTGLANMYLIGRGGLQKNEAETVRWYRKAADKEYADAQAGLGYMYQNGLGGLKQSDTEAVKWYLKAAKQNLPLGQALLAYMYESGLGVEKQDKKEAARLYRAAADQGNAYGQGRLGLMFKTGQGGLEKNHVEAVKLFRQSAEQGNATGQEELGLMYAAGSGGLEQNIAEAIKWFSKSAEQGRGSSAALAGLMYEIEFGGFKKNEAESRKWYEKAAKMGDATGQFKLAKIYLSESGGFNKINNEAVQYFLKAANQGHAKAQTHVGIMHSFGYGGLEKSDTEAAKWYRKGAENGDADGQMSLGYMYEIGMGGLEKSQSEAIKWYRAAARQGQELSQKRLKELNVNW